MLIAAEEMDSPATSPDASSRRNCGSAPTVASTVATTAASSRTPRPTTIRTHERRIVVRPIRASCRPSSRCACRPWRRRAYVRPQVPTTAPACRMSRVPAAVWPSLVTVRRSAGVGDEHGVFEPVRGPQRLDADLRRSCETASAPGDAVCAWCLSPPRRWPRARPSGRRPWPSRGGPRSTISRPWPWLDEACSSSV